MRVHARTLAIFGGLLGCWTLSPAWADPPQVKVMTQNMDAGTDFGFIFGATTLEALVQGTQATFAEIQTSNIPERAARLADEIAARQPDLIALQEVTQYWTRTAGGLPVLKYDQLTSLLTALAVRGQHYTPAVVNPLMAAESPLAADLSLFLGALDSDVILVRVGVAATNPQAHRFSLGATLIVPTPLGNLPVWQGWSSVDVAIGTRSFRFVDTHLEGVSSGVPQSLTAQLAQAGELVQALSSTDMPMALCGDFNANADPGKEHYATTDLILSAGFADAWRATNRAKGNTWPLHQEDPFRPLAGPYERIDLVFARGVTPIAAERIGYRLTDRTASGLWPSDHAGVITVLGLE